MPLYEYECQVCSRVFEIWQKVSDDPKSTCPECSGPLRKLVSLSSFQLKGSGWYADGYAAKPETAKTDGAKPDATAAKNGGTGEKKSEKTGEGKQAPKPAAGTAGSETA